MTKSDIVNEISKSTGIENYGSEGHRGVYGKPQTIAC
jgi:hypothetical protein